MAEEMRTGGEPNPPTSIPVPSTGGSNPLDMILLKPKPSPVLSARARLEELIGRDFARFLIASLSEATAAPADPRRGS